MTRNERDKPTMPAEAWEYLAHQIKVTDVPAYIRTMNELGAQGWELVTAPPLSMGGSFRHVAGDTNELLLLFKRCVTRFQQ